MDSEELINVCQAAKHGNFRMVRNTKTNQQGTVLNVEGNNLTVLVETDSEIWDYEDCKNYYKD